ncbi:MAG: Uma2 family endonuclease [Anaerolineae bacterium]|nr:Uma2 family endonuclease [Anaerolineae bacterium]
MLAGKQAVTAAEYEAFIARPENLERRFELIEGEIVEKMPTQQHGIITLNLAGELRAFVKAHSLGRVAVEARYRPPDDAENDRLPDISFVADLSKPVTEDGAVPFMPDLAVEVKSPTDSVRKLREKARFYLAHGVRLVWLVFPEPRIVEVYAPDDEYTLSADQSLTGGDLLPGFTLPVRQIFEV